MADSKKNGLNLNGFEKPFKNGETSSKKINEKGTFTCKELRKRKQWHKNNKVINNKKKTVHNKISSVRVHNKTCQ